MIPGVRGRLLTTAFIRDVLPTLPEVTPPPPAFSRGLAQWVRRIESTLGAASSVRAVAEVALIPLVHLLGLSVARRADDSRTCCLHLTAGARSVVVAVATGWGEPLDRVWRSGVVSAVAADARWCFSTNGRSLRIVDARRTWSRDYLELDLVLLGSEDRAQSLLWTIGHAGAMSSEPAVLDRAADLSSRHGVQVCRALGDGVLDALALLLGALARSGRRPAETLWEQSLTVLYRVLFLLFAEARGLLPVWHPVYRDRYSLEAIVGVLLVGGSYRGLWRAVQAISRLAHAGCSAGELRVTAFNGRLFAPAHAAAFDSARPHAVVSSGLVRGTPYWNEKRMPGTARPGMRLRS